MSISISSPVRTTAISPPDAASGETWPIDSPDVPPEKAAVGNQRAGFVEVLGFEVRRGVEHLLHAGTSLGSFVADDDRLARLHFVAENALDSLFLRFVDPCAAAENVQRLIDARRLDDAAAAGDVASSVRPVLRRGSRRVRRRGYSPSCGLRRGRRNRSAALPVRGCKSPAGALSQRRRAASVSVSLRRSQASIASRSVRPSMRGTEVSSRPARASSPRMERMPPARLTSCM